jgi:hypothetical protein
VFIAASFTNFRCKIPSHIFYCSEAKEGDAMDQPPYVSSPIMRSIYRSVGIYNHVVTFNNNEHYGWLTWSFGAGGEHNSRQKRDKLGAMSCASSVELLLTRTDLITLHADMDSLYTAMTYLQ